MADTFAISEVLELAVRIEINGKDFYGILAKQSKNENAKDIFKHLTEEEEKHRKTFQEMLDSVKTSAPEGTYPEEYYAYMRALADGKVFTQRNQGKEAAAKVKNEKEALDLGIDAEKYSIIFYEGMKKLVPGEDNKIIDVVISEEKDHLKQLVELKAVLD